MKQNEFNFQTSYGYHFISISIGIKRLMESRLKPYNLTHLQFSILMYLYRKPATTQKEMLKHIYGDEASVTRLIDRLEQKGYLKRVPCAKDKRKKNILLTSQGIALTKEMMQYALEVNRELTAELSQEEADELLRLLQKVHIAIDTI